MRLEELPHGLEGGRGGEAHGAGAVEGEVAGQGAALGALRVLLGDVGGCRVQDPALQVGQGVKLSERVSISTVVTVDTCAWQTLTLQRSAFQWLSPRCRECQVVITVSGSSSVMTKGMTSSETGVDGSRVVAVVVVVDGP